uniref:Uncharacterized protein n=1 Tax=Arundo donax TaxID=35708 RepID=A0A0A9HLI8_ARUDO
MEPSADEWPMLMKLCAPLGIALPMNSAIACGPFGPVDAEAAAAAAC